MGFSSVSCHNASSHSGDNVWFELTPLHPELAWICVEIDQGCLSTIQSILRCILSTIFLFHPQPGRFATVPCCYKLLDYIAHSGQRNFKISGDWLVTLRLLIFFHNFAWQFSALLSIIPAWCGTHRHTTQRLASVLISILPAPVTCHRWVKTKITCLKWNYLPAVLIGCQWFCPVDFWNFV